MPYIKSRLVAKKTVLSGFVDCIMKNKYRTSMEAHMNLP
jgi:hypothetical protein